MNTDTIKSIKITGLFILIIFVLPTSCLMTTCHPRVGLFPESSFQLSPDSRLPKWFALPEGYSRSDLTVEIYYFTNPFSKSNFKTILLGPPPEKRKLETKIGVHYWHPDSVKRGITENPAYIVASVNSLEEIIEHKKPGAIFSITDNSKFKKR